MCKGQFKVKYILSQVPFLHPTRWLYWILWIVLLLRCYPFPDEEKKKKNLRNITKLPKATYLVKRGGSIRNHFRGTIQLDLSLGLDLRVMNWSPVLGSTKKKKGNQCSIYPIGFSYVYYHLDIFFWDGLFKIFLLINILGGFSFSLWFVRVLDIFWMSVLSDICIENNHSWSIDGLFIFEECLTVYRSLYFSWTTN